MTYKQDFEKPSFKESLLKIKHQIFSHLQLGSKINSTSFSSIGGVKYNWQTELLTVTCRTGIEAKEYLYRFNTFVLATFFLSSPSSCCVSWRACRQFQALLYAVLENGASPPRNSFVSKSTQTDAPSSREEEKAEYLAIGILTEAVQTLCNYFIGRLS